MLIARHMDSAERWPQVSDEFLHDAGITREGVVRRSETINGSYAMEAAPGVAVVMCVDGTNVDCPHGARSVIAVMPKGTITKKSIMGADDATIEVFHVKRLQLTITEHQDYLPQARVHPQEVNDEVFGRFGINQDKLPCMFYGDPVARFFGWHVGDIIRITFHEDDRDDMVQRTKYRVVFPNPPPKPKAKA